MSELIRKYNQPGPRYTSYPTVPFWKDMDISKEAWKQSVIEAILERRKKEVSLYIHLPFCEQLCTFCGCHKRITKNHSVEEPYLVTVLKEWQLYTSFLGEDMVIKEIHLGGGTPTFFKAENLERLITGIQALSIFDENISLSFEAHPNNTGRDHLRVLHQLGFKRLSFGIQDYDPKVQLTINRIQSFEQVQSVHQMALDMGYTSISHDIIYGLPHQTLESIKDTIAKTAQLKPHRISFYSYAHVPWIKGVGQRGYSEDDLPKNEEKQALYEYGKAELLKLGYEEIGMDHFALPEDELSKAHHQGSLHRNFMGYTTQSTEVMIGLGMSAISDAWGAFAQNEKHVEDYQATINSGELAVFRGHFLSEEDKTVRRLILDLMCRYKATIPTEIANSNFINEELLQELLNDDLIRYDGEELEILEKGKPFLRNVCMCFDLKLNQREKREQLFSSTI